MRAVMDAANINLDEVDDDKVREFAAQLIVELRHKQAFIEKLTHEMAVLKRLKYASSQSEGFSGEQKSLLQEVIDEDLEALSRELEREQPATFAGMYQFWVQKGRDSAGAP